MEVIQLNKNQKFTLKTAQEVLPVIYKITETAQKEVKVLVSRMEAIKSMSGARASEIEAEINAIVDRWQQKVAKLGATPKGLWLADFDNGKGYYCWKFPETEISFSHGYNDGFSGRAPIHTDTHAH